MKVIRIELILWTGRQETRKYVDVFAFNLLRKKPSFIKYIFNLRFLKTGVLSEFELYLGLMNTLTSSVYHCFHGNGSVNGILAQSSIALVINLSKSFPRVLIPLSTVLQSTQIRALQTPSPRTFSMCSSRSYQ